MLRNPDIRRPQRGVIALLLLFALWGAWHSSWQPQHSAGAPPRHSINACDDQNANHETRRDCTDEAIARYTYWLAIVTCILAVATIGLGVGTFFQIRFARAEYISTHRPVLRLRRIFPPDLIPGQPFGVQIIIGNIGDTPATIYQIGCAFYFDNFAPDASPRDYPNPLPIPAGLQSIITINHAPLDEAQIDAIELGTAEWRMVGIINYRDDNNIVRCTSFARKYKPSLRRFDPLRKKDPEGDREYEN